MVKELDKLKKTSWFSFNLDYLKEHPELWKNKLSFIELYSLLMRDIIFFVKGYAEQHKDSFLHFWLSNNLNFCFANINVNEGGVNMVRFLFSVYLNSYDIICYILFNFRSTNKINAEYTLFSHWRLFLFRFSSFCDSFFVNSSNKDFYFNLIIIGVYFFKILDLNRFNAVVTEIPTLFNAFPGNASFEYFINYKFTENSFFDSLYCNSNVEIKNKSMSMLYNLLYLHNFNLNDADLDYSFKNVIFNLIFDNFFIIFIKYKSIILAKKLPKEQK